MSRIRTIKPEFFTSADIIELTPLSRLFYVSLWCESDRDGRLNWNTKTLKFRYFPADNCDIDEMAAELIDAGLILIYEVDGKTYAEIPSFTTHQVINNRESESLIPPRVKDASKRRQSGVQGEGKEGREGKGREGISPEPPSDSPPAEPFIITIPLIDKTEHGIPQKQIDEWTHAYPAVDVSQKLREMRQWCIANPANKKTAKGVVAFIVRWLSKEQDKGGRTGNQPMERLNFI